jgi:hypothetical protein
MRIIQYTTLPASTDENERLIRAVFTELEQIAVRDVRYAVLRTEGAGFVHLVGQNAATTGLTSLESFKAFQAGVKARVVTPPVVSEAQIIGNYRFLAAHEAARS